MTEIMELLKSQLSKMNVDGSWIFGAVSGGLTIAIPQWIYTQGWSMNHSILIGILVGVIGMISIHALTRSATIKQKSDNVDIVISIHALTRSATCPLCHPR